LRTIGTLVLAVIAALGLGAALAGAVIAVTSPITLVLVPTNEIENVVKVTAGAVVVGLAGFGVYIFSRRRIRAIGDTQLGPRLTDKAFVIAAMIVVLAAWTLWMFVIAPILSE
jgi:hypothetical protein